MMGPHGEVDQFCEADFGLPTLCLALTGRLGPREDFAAKYLTGALA
jgi:hypothetical protein